MRKFGLVTGALVVATGTAGAFYVNREQPAPEIVTARVERGDIVETVSATGTLEALTTVQVGTQISGSIQALNADFNSIVRKGQVIARLDPSIIQAQVEQQRANVAGAEADRERLCVAVADARTKLERARDLWDKQLIPKADLDTAEVTLRSVQAQLRAADAQVAQVRASLNQAQVNLAKTVITAPIDGTVIARNVDVGQTVAASLQAPTLYVIAADLSKMRVSASIDEAEVSRVLPGQRVSFTVDAYPSEEFDGTVSQVRLNPVVQQNVVTYATLIDVDNPGLKLKPGMTATVSIEVARRDDVLRVPVGALRFSPPAELQRATAGPAAPAPRGANGNRGGRATVWHPTDEGLAALSVRTGATDGRYTEVSGESVEAGVVVAIAVANSTDAAARPASGGASNPLMGPQRPGGAGGRR